MIKAIITDVDGVIVGKKKGINYPLPNYAVIKELKGLHKKGIPIVLCTAKFGYSIYEIIKQAELKNPHITDGGALIIDLLSKKVIKEHNLDKEIVTSLAAELIKSDIYTECYGVKEYFIDKNQNNKFSEKRTELLQKPPQIVDNLLGVITNADIIKVIIFSKNETERSMAESILSNFEEQINFIWSMHPALEPNKPGIITKKEVSKKSASLEVLESLRISPDETLGIGDSLADWHFMEICKYVGTVGENQELKDLVKKKGPGKFFLGSSVDENGFLDILDYFKL